MDENYKIHFNKPRNNGKFKFIDLFAGIGGIRIPFEELGGECVFTSEWEKYAQQTYEANFGEVPEGDITKIPVDTIPKHDILLAGFPCQPFSMAGKKKGFDDTRGTLFFNIEKILEYHKPPVVFLENVKNLKTHDQGRTFAVIKKHLEDLGYTVFDKVLNAKEFGVPQNRERIYIICFRDPNINFTFPTPPKTKVKVGDILEKDLQKDYTISDRLWLGHQKRKEENRKNGKGFGFSLFDEESPYTSTITARYYKDGAEILIKQDGKNPRKVTPREAARLQGFPDSFKIPVSDTQAYKQFGNSVAIPVIRAIAQQIFKYINFDKKNNANK
jgi:DNA (cytosine-5)-methyltransferase 1